MVRRSKRCVGSRRTSRRTRRHSRHSTRSRRIRRVHSRHTRGRRIHDVKMGGVWGDIKIGPDGKKYLQNADGTWDIHPTEVKRSSKLSAAFGVNKLSSDRGRQSVRSSAPVVRKP